MAEKLEFDLLVKQNDLNKTLKEASNQAQSLSSMLANGVRPVQELNTQIEKTSSATSIAADFMGQFKTQALGVAAGQFVFSALNSAIGFVVSSVQESVAAFADQEDALNKLNQSLSLTGSLSESAVEGVENFASSLESVSRFSDDAIIRQVAFARSLGLTTARSQELVQAAANLSATLGGTLEESVDKLGKTLSGSAGRLQQYIPELKSLTVEQLKAGDAADVINKKFSGAAANDLKTYSGQTSQLKNAFNNLQESIGEVIVKSAPYQAFLSASKKYIDELNVSVKGGAIYTELLSNKYDVASKTSSQLANDSKALGEKLKLLQKELQQQEDLDLFDGQSTKASGLRFEIEGLIKAQKILDDQLKSGKTKAETPDTPPVKTKTNEEIDAIAKRNAEILALNSQLVLDSQAIADQAEIQKINNETVRNEAELQRVYDQEIKKAQIVEEQKLQSLSVGLSAADRALEVEKIQSEKRLAFIDAYGKKEQASRGNLLKTRQAAEDAMVAYEQKKNKEREANQRDTFSTIATLSQSNNKTLAFIGKSAGITQIAIDTPVAVGKALAAFPPPFNFAAASLVGAAMAAQAAKIAGVQFEQGGFVGGLNGATVGADNRVATIRDGEMILNADDQRVVYNAIKSGSLGGGDIVIQVDGREIARAVRSQVQQGFRIA